MGDYRLAAELIDQLQSQLTAITADRDNLRERLGVAEELLREGAGLIAFPDIDGMKLKAKVLAFLTPPPDAPADDQKTTGYGEPKP